MIQKRIKELRKENELTQRELAEKIGVTRGAVGHYERGKRLPDYKILKKLSKLFNVSIDYMLGETENKNRNNSLPKNTITDMEWLPVLDKIPAGRPVLDQENIKGYHPTPTNQINNKDDHFWLQVCEDKMKDVGITDGDLVLIRQQEKVENGEIAVVMVNTHDATLKKVYKSEDQLILQPANDNYEPIFVENEKASIIGKKVGHYTID